MAAVGFDSAQWEWEHDMISNLEDILLEEDENYCPEIQHMWLCPRWEVVKKKIEVKEQGDRRRIRRLWEKDCQGRTVEFENSLAFRLSSTFLIFFFLFLDRVMNAEKGASLLATISPHFVVFDDMYVQSRPRPSCSHHIPFFTKPVTLSSICLSDSPNCC